MKLRTYMGRIPASTLCNNTILSTEDTRYCYAPHREISLRKPGLAIGELEKMQCYAAISWPTSPLIDRQI